jgi:hypothetical protein
MVISIGHFGHAFLLALAVKFCPVHADVIPIEALSSMLPEYLMRHGDLSEAKKWSLAIIEAGFAILQNIITVTNSQAKCTGL